MFEMTSFEVGVSSCLSLHSSIIHKVKFAIFADLTTSDEI